MKQIKELLVFLRLHLRPYAQLRRELCERLTRGSLVFHMEFSGRVAIRRLAAALATRLPARRALIPDYLCNVVAAALEKAGYQWESYPTNESFEGEADDLFRRLEEKDVGLFLTASVYGSGANLQLLAQERFRQLLLARGVHILVDCCQDIRLIDHLPEGYGDRLSAVVSFNDKSFPGAMGGGILTAYPLPAAGSFLSLNRLLRFYRRAAVRWLQRLFARDTHAHCYEEKPAAAHSTGPHSAGPRSAGAFEYSRCQQFPYRMKPWRPAKIQLVLALMGLDSLPDIEAQKAKMMSRCPGIRQLPYVATAAYWVIDGDWASLPAAMRYRKRPYAVHGQPGKSVYPHLKAIYSMRF